MKIVADSKKFQKLRISRGYSQNELAKTADLSNTVIIRVESGLNISPSSIKKICDSLNINFDDYFKIDI